MGGASRRIATGLGLLLVIGLAWEARVVDRATVFTREGIRAAGPDAYYHLRRVAWGYASFPHVLERDPYLNYPYGGEVIWSPGLDWAVAGAARLVLGAGAPPERLERFALRVPPVLGVLTVAGVFLLGARRYGLAAGTIAAALLAVLPAHGVYTRLGMLDHHALEPLLTLAFLASGAALLEGARAGRARAAGAALALGGTAAAAFLVWPGFLLQLALVDLVLLAVVFGSAERVPAVAWAAAAAHAVAALALAPWWGREWDRWGDFALVVLGSFQPWLLAVAACVFATGALRLRPAARLAAAAAVGAVLLAASLVLFPALGEAPGRAWDWLARTESFQGQVSESRPLLGADPEGRLAATLRLLSLLALGLPFLVLGRARSLRRAGAGAAAGWLILAMVVGLGAAALSQRRFVAALSVPYVLLWGWLLGRALPDRLRGLGAAARLATSAAVALAVLLALVPIASFYAPALKRRQEAAAGRPLTLAVDQWRRHELHRLADWLRANTPETSGFDAPDGAPEYGILAHWSNGHVLVYVARRPTVVGNFGDDLGEENWQAGNRYFGLAEPDASSLLDRLRVRYAILEFRNQPPLDTFEPDSMVARGALADGGLADVSPRRRDGERTEVPGRYPAFERHRLVHETRTKPWATEQPFFKVYEHVAGARVEGRAAPGATVGLALDLETGRGRRLVWRAEARADGAGRWSLRVPYATRGAPPDVVPASAYRVTSGGREASLVVEERDVQEGRRVVGPDLTEGPGR